MPKKSRNYEAWELETLSDPVLAANYLNAALEDSQEMFLVAMRSVVQAQSQMTSVAREIGVQRESLYRALSKTGNPTFFDMLKPAVEAVGFRMIVVPLVVAATAGHGRIVSGYKTRAAAIRHARKLSSMDVSAQQSFRFDAAAMQQPKPETNSNVEIAKASAMDIRFNTSVAGVPIRPESATMPVGIQPGFFNQRAASGVNRFSVEGI